MKFLNIKIIVVFLFLLSGICGLIYEVAWSKYLALFIGSTAYSHMIVLATYMGGLALGAFVFGKYSDKVSNQLKLYGLLELGIGVYCLAYPFVIELVGNLFIQTSSAFHGSSQQGMLLTLKFILSFITLILPTVLMGGTLPILTRFLSKSISDSGKDVAKLYYINSLGAVIGTALAGFFLIRLQGLDNTVWIASSFNIVIGLFALLLAKFVKSIVQSISSKVKADEQHQVFGSTTYSFTVMLIAFISGIAIGSFIVSLVIRKIKNLVAFLAICQYGTAVSIILTLPLYERLPYYLMKLSATIPNQPDNFIGNVAACCKSQIEEMRLMYELNPNDHSAIFDYLNVLVDYYRIENSIVNPQQMDDAVELMQRCIQSSQGREEHRHMFIYKSMQILITVKIVFRDELYLLNLDR